MNRLRRATFSCFTLSVIALLAACSADDPSPAKARAPAPAVPEPDLVILGGVMLDMVADHPEPKPLKALLIRDGQIERIIAADSAEAVPTATNTIDAGSSFILPGFFDAHVHFRPFLPDARIWKRASNFYGITSLFDTGPCGGRCVESGQDPNEWIKAYKDLMNSSAVTDGPTLFMTGRRIQSLDGTHPLGMKFSTRAEVSDYLDSLVELGVDGVKVEASLSAELRAIVVDEANARNLPVVGHSRDAYESIAAGMKFIEHMWPITSSIAISGSKQKKYNSPQSDHLMDLEKAPALVQSLVDNGVYVNPTMMGRHGFFADSMQGQADIDFQSMDSGGIFEDMRQADKDGVRKWWARPDGLDAEQIRLYQKSLENVSAFLRLFSEAGGKILVATDSGEDKLIGMGLHREMKMLGIAGITPYRILLGATRWPAEMTYKNASIGTIEEGKRADFVLLGSDPTADISNTLDIQYVIKSGTILRGATETPGT